VEIKTMADIQVGSVVKLKSGGPVMTVTKLSDISGRSIAVCHWFTKDNKSETGNFPVESLQAWE
jgi:uncharacterized protein YodC (DUF2158 family)